MDAITLQLDAAPLQAALAETLALLGEAARRSAPFAERAVDLLLCLANTGDQLARIERDDAAATDAGVVLFRLQPSDAVLGLRAALRAGDFDLGILEQLGHGLGSIGGLTTPMIAESGAAAPEGTLPVAAPDISDAGGES